MLHKAVETYPILFRDFTSLFQLELLLTDEWRNLKMASYSLKPIVDVCQKNWVWNRQTDVWMDFFQLTDINCGIL